jgi:hypothetical protein
MSIGIDIDVNSRKVLEARKNVEFLNKALNETEKADITPGGSGEKIDPKAMKGALDSAGKYRKEMEGAASAVNKIVKDYDKLIKMPKPLSSIDAERINRPSIAPASAYNDYQNAIRESIERSFGKRPAHVPFGEQFRRDNPGWRPPGSGGGEDEGRIDKSGSSMATIKKVLGWGLAAEIGRAHV